MGYFTYPLFSLALFVLAHLNYVSTCHPIISSLLVDVPARPAHLPSVSTKITKLQISHTWLLCYLLFRLDKYILVHPIKALTTKVNLSHQQILHTNIMQIHLT